MRLEAIPAPAFSLTATLESGQVFHWTRDGDGWTGLIDATPCHAAQQGERLLVTSGCADVARRYFALDHPLDEILATFPADDYTRAAVLACRGMRIIRQPRWECLATFITSAMKQVAHIRQMSLALRSRFGRAVTGSTIAAYPTPAAIAALTERDLRACGLGFRAPTLLATARLVDEGALDLDAIAMLPTPEARDVLCKLPGVGEKVANCVLLFAYERLEAVPVDVWIGRILRAMVGGSVLPAREVDRFCQSRLGQYAGYVQQYLFHHARISKTLPVG